MVDAKVLIELEGGLYGNGRHNRAAFVRRMVQEISCGKTTMTEIKGSNPRIIFNGVDLTKYIDGDTLTAAVNTALADVITSEVTVGIGRAITLALEDMRFTFVGVRPAVRQSCLWRHSFNWRNRKRGHPAHREGKA